MGVTEEIAYLLAGFKIHLSSDNAEVVRIVVYYIWCVEGEPMSQVTLGPTSHLSPPAGIITESLWSCLGPAGVYLHTLKVTKLHVSAWDSLLQNILVPCSVLRLSADPGLLGQPRNAHEVHGPASVSSPFLCYFSHHHFLFVIFFFIVFLFFLLQAMTWQHRQTTPTKHSHRTSRQENQTKQNKQSSPCTPLSFVVNVQ